MLEVVRPKASAAAATAGFDVEILSVATANPSFQLSQAEATAARQGAFPASQGAVAALRQYRHRASLQLRTDRVVSQAAQLGKNAPPSFQKHALDLLEEVTLKATAAAGIALDAIDILVTNTITGLADPEPRRQAVQSAQAHADDRTAADVRPWLRRRRRRAGARDAARAGDRRRACAVPYRRPVQPVPARQRSEPGDVRVHRAVRRRRGRRAVAQHGGRRKRRPAHSRHRRMVLAATPSTSWAGTSRTTVSASCSARNCRR